MKLIILAQCRIEREVDVIDKETIQSVFEELCDAPVGQILEGKEIMVGEE